VRLFGTTAVWRTRTTRWPFAHLTRGALAILAYGALGYSAARADEPASLADRLAAAGITPSLTYNGEIATVVAGGAKRGVVYAGNLHMQLAFDGERLATVPGLSGWLDVMWVNGGLPGNYAGDAQGVSAFAASPALRLYEAWLEYNFADNHVSILGGRYDLNTEFYHLASAGMFLNASFGIGPEFASSGFAGPSIFPDTSLAVRLAYKPANNIVLQTAILDGAPLDRMNGSPPPFDPHNGVLLVAEAAFLKYRPSGDPEEDLRFHVGRANSQAAYDDKFAVGAWYYTARLNESGVPVPAPARHQGQGGAYATLDHLLIAAEDDPKRRLSGFIQLGFADRTVNRFGTYIGGGLVASGVIAGRTDDQLGLAFAMARNGSHYIGAQQQLGVPVNAAETTLEVSYLAQLTPWIAVQPDVQYVIHPNTDPAIANATVLQMRVTVTF
jgi:porin